MSCQHGRRSQEDRGGQFPSQFGVGDAKAFVPLRFRHIHTKMSVLWPSKYAKIRFRPGLCPGPRWGSSRRSPRLPNRLGRGHPSPYPTHSAPTHLRRSPYVPSEVQPDLRLCLSANWFVSETLSRHADVVHRLQP